MTAMVVDLPDLPELHDGPAWLDGEAREAVSRQLAARLQAVEMFARWCESEIAVVLDLADRHGLYSIDGHRNMRSWAAATVNWSNAECLHRARTVHLVRDVPAVGSDLSEGKLGLAQTRELARLHANPRCGDQLIEVVDTLVQAAKDLPFEQFKLVAKRWEQHADADGAHRGHEAAHNGRRVTTAAMADTVHLSAQFGTVQGSAMLEILSQFEEAEFHCEWQELKSTHGDAMNPGLLERTRSQRRADALYAIFRAAVSTPVGAQPPEPVVNIVVDQATFEEHLEAVLTGAPPPQRDPGDLSRRCETDMGIPVDAYHAVVAAILGHVRRVVMDSAGVVTDMGRKRRLFSGSVRTAVFLQMGRRCTWPGCGRTLGIQIDHAADWQHRGATCTENGDPLCNWHNPFKNHGYTIVRDDRGHWHTYRPDGTEITPI